jgi:hypothetical protein
MINTTGLTHPALDKITRITPSMAWLMDVPACLVPRADHPDLDAAAAARSIRLVVVALLAVALA